MKQAAQQCTKLTNRWLDVYFVYMQRHLEVEDVCVFFEQGLCHLGRPAVV